MAGSIGNVPAYVFVLRLLDNGDQRLEGNWIPLKETPPKYPELAVLKAGVASSWALEQPFLHAIHQQQQWWRAPEFPF